MNEKNLNKEERREYKQQRPRGHHKPYPDDQITTMLI
jgi:hypothetical protein